MNHIIFSMTLAVATLAFGAAHAMPAGEAPIRMVVSTVGLDLHTAAGARALDQRVKVAATKVCEDILGVDNTLGGADALDVCVRQAVKAAMAGTDRKS